MLAEGDISEAITLVCDKHIRRLEGFRPTALCPRVYQTIVCDSLVRVVLKAVGLWTAGEDEQDKFFEAKEPVCCTQFGEEDWAVMETAILTRMCKAIQHDPNMPRA